MTRCASAPCGIHMKPPRSSPAAGTDKSNSGTRSVLVCVFVSDWGGGVGLVLGNDGQNGAGFTKDMSDFVKNLE